MVLRLFPALLLCAAMAGAAEPAAIAWRQWQDGQFAEAKPGGRLVLLHLGADWCHWCHVMEATTYRDPEVVALVGEHFLAVHVDQDGRPDLANRYEDYGWPATVIFDGDGRELVKLRGYLPPERMRSLLRAVVADPTPGPSVVNAAAAVSEAVGDGLTPDQRQRLVESWRAGYDTAQAGWGTGHKYLDADAVEYALLRSAFGDGEALRRADDTLRAAAALIDPVWGGMYQYSTGGVWSEPHFEKIMAYQADALRIYALGAMHLPDGGHGARAQAISRYLAGFLTSPEGAFYTSQDADPRPGEHGADYFARDDAGRRGLGMPRIDIHRYARENGWAIQALCQAYAAGDDDALVRAERAARWVIAHRRCADGGYAHDEGGASSYLGDTLAMGRAFIALHQATGEAQWLEQARAAFTCIAGFPAVTTVGDRVVGVLTARGGGVLAATPQRDEHVALARGANRLFRLTGEAAFHELSLRAMRWLARPGIAERVPTAGTLLADHELLREPLHITVHGPIGDPAADALARAALAWPEVYLVVERAPGAVAAIVCRDGTCRKPARTVEELRVRLMAR
jgi:hypothetical protein